MALIRHRVLLRLALLAAVFLTGCDQAGQADYPSLSDALTPGIFLEPEERAVLPAGVELRPVYPKGIEVTKFAEGFRGRLYNDAAGYCTIGYGHLIKKAACDGTEPPGFRGGITEPDGEELLRTDMRTPRSTVMRVVSVDLTDGQYAALCDFVFNVGRGNFQSSTLLKRVNAGRFDDVPFQLRRWVFAGGKRLAGLEQRRQREIELFFDGIGIPRAMPSPDEDLAPVDIRLGETAL